MPHTCALGRLSDLARNDDSSDGLLLPAPPPSLLRTYLHPVTVYVRPVCSPDRGVLLAMRPVRIRLRLTVQLRPTRGALILSIREFARMTRMSSDSLWFGGRGFFPASVRSDMLQ